MQKNRRLFLQATGIGLGGLIVPTSIWADGGNWPANAFNMPTLYEGKRTGTEVVFDLNMQQAKSRFLQGVTTATLGINGDFLGPVLRAKRGDTVRMNVTNQIGSESTLHWHGFTLPANMDGGPHQSIDHGKTWNANFTIRQPAATLWYHSHQMHRTGEQVYQGLAGMFIVDDEDTDKQPLPSTYGVDDVPVILQDRAFDRSGNFRYVSMMPERMHGMHGDTMLVNGIVAPTLKAQRTLMRLRLHNGSNARIYKLAFNDNRPFHVIAGDCGLLPEPVQMNRLVLAPAERVEILVDLSDRKQVVLKNLTGAVQSNGMMGMMMQRMGFDREFDIMRIDPADAVNSKYKLPSSLLAPKQLNPDKAVGSRPIELNMGMMGGMMRGMGQGKMGDGMFTINGRSMDINRIDFSVKHNTSEIWQVSNPSPMAHPFHVHNTQFQILSRNDRQPAPHERGLKDVVLLNPGDQVGILVPFPDYVDREIPYMYHCHILEHEDQGMMGQFTVT